MSKASANRSPEPRLVLVGRCSAALGAELAGSATALADFAGLLLAGAADAVYSLTVPDDASPNPYDAILVGLRIIHSGGLALIRRQDRLLLVRGSAVNLGSIAAGVRDLCGAPHVPEAHVHEEYYPGHLYLDPESEPLVIVMRERP
ncbi:MAG TPA: hypothetical protein VFJ58_03590 [Armatimonadota bacterium]|nr:hypothetical protein [Armatimonadota bacterium]